MSASIACPDCTSRAQVRTSRAITPTYRQLHLRCSNDDCGHTFAAELTITHTISPSACPDPSIDLRQAPPRRRADNDNRGPGVSLAPAAAANDDDALPEAFGFGA